MKVFINPGHAPGGIPDPGAVNEYRHTEEWAVAAEVGRLLSHYLNAVEIETEILQDDSLDAICQAANKSGADLFVSIHCNGYIEERAHGTETWYYEGSFNGRKLAMSIQAQIVASIGTYDRCIKDTVDFWVLKHTNMPAVLVELGFITNNRDCKLLEEEQPAFAAAIARGITDFIAM